MKQVAADGGERRCSCSCTGRASLNCPAGGAGLADGDLGVGELGDGDLGDGACLAGDSGVGDLCDGGADGNQPVRSRKCSFSCKRPFPSKPRFPEGLVSCAASCGGDSKVGSKS